MTKYNKISGLLHTNHHYSDLWSIANFVWDNWNQSNVQYKILPFRIPVQNQTEYNYYYVQCSFQKNEISSNL